jgi:hypothetical protein
MNNDYNRKNITKLTLKHYKTQNSNLNRLLKIFERKWQL